MKIKKINDLSKYEAEFTITGAASGAACASTLGMWAQAGINAFIGATTYVGTQFMNGSEITLGGLLSSAFFGFVIGTIGGNGWVQNAGVRTFIDSGEKGFIKNIVSNVGLSSLIKIVAPAVVFGGFASGLYEKYITNQFNPDGKFIGVEKDGSRSKNIDICIFNNDNIYYIC